LRDSAQQVGQYNLREVNSDFKVILINQPHSTLGTTTMIASVCNCQDCFLGQ